MYAEISFDHLSSPVEVTYKYDPATNRVRITGMECADLDFDPTDEDENYIYDMCAVAAKKELMTTAQATDLYRFESFAAPYAIVTRKIDNMKGTLLFSNDPRYYFDFEPLNK